MDTATATAVRSVRAARSSGSRIAKRLLAALARARQRRALAALSDTLLRDIGLTRAEFMRLTEAPGLRDPDFQREPADAPRCRKMGT